MAALFFDTSALVKYYHPEVGSAVVEDLFAKNGGRVVISALGVLEFQSALATKVRSKQIGRDEAGALRLRFMLDIASGTVQVARFMPKHIKDAGRLLSRYSCDVPLRTLDALQLAVAAELYGEDGLQSFVAADDRLIDVARRERLPVVNPNQAD